MFEELYFNLQKDKTNEKFNHVMSLPSILQSSSLSYEVDFVFRFDSNSLQIHGVEINFWIIEDNPVKYTPQFITQRAFCVFKGHIKLTEKSIRHIHDVLSKHATRSQRSNL